MVEAPRLRVVFLGTPAFAVPTLERLLGSSHSVVGVVTQPDRPRGRGQRTIDGPVKATANAAGLPVLQPEKLRDAAFVRELASLGADIGVVAAYGKILPEAMLAQPRLGMINVHASLLPRHRGAAPVHRAIMAGDRETGITIMRVVKALDAGPMLARASRAIGPDETSDELERDLATLGADLLVDTLDLLSSGSVGETLQDESLATYAPRLTKEDGLIDWSCPSPAIHNQVRGLHPWPHAYSFLDGRRLIIRRSALVDHTEGSAPAPGTVVAAYGDDLRIATGSGLIGIKELQAEGKRPMTPREFLAGHHVRAGDSFTNVERRDR
jgi:methionyl-tRNA formyltransferase